MKDTLEHINLYLLHYNTKLNKFLRVLLAINLKMAELKPLSEHS